MASYDDVILELKRQTNSKTIKELSQKLGVSSRNFNTWKTRGEIPERTLALLAHKIGVGMGCLNNTLAIGQNNIAVNGSNNTINGIPRYSKKVDEFLALYEKYGNEDLDCLLDEIIEKLECIRDISKREERDCVLP
ncbi:MAG: helix-turn-helix domain-containing protein [Wolinella sp.]